MDLSGNIVKNKHMENKLKELRDVIHKAVPYIKCIHCDEQGFTQNSLERVEGMKSSKVCYEKDCIGGYREIRLCEVMLAIHETKRTFSVDDYGTFYEYKPDDETHDNHEEWQQIFGGDRYYWNLLDDNIDNNPQCWDFLHSVLVTNNK